MKKQPIPVYILTGFLGSGKSTVLNYLVSSQEFSKTMVIINEFGEVGLDHLLVKSTSESMIEMSSGCICCTIRTDLRKTLKDIQWRFSRQGQRQFDRVFIETTGLADPAPIIHTIISSPELAKDYELRSIISTIDSTCFTATQVSQFEAKKQAAVADVLVLTKQDLVSQEDSQKIEAQVRSLNPSALILKGSKGVIPISSLLDIPSFSTLNKEEDVRKWLDEEAYLDGDHHSNHHHDHHHDHHNHEHDVHHEMHHEEQPEGHHHGEEDHHSHDINRHGEEIQAFCISHDEPIPEKAFLFWINMLMSMMGENMLRIKGLVNVKEHPGPMVIHGVQHIFYPVHKMEKWPDLNTSTRIVFITKGIDKKSIEDSLQSLEVH